MSKFDLTMVIFIFFMIFLIRYFSCLCTSATEKTSY